jgi:beta-mannosidase
MAQPLEAQPLSSGWQVAGTAPDACARPSALGELSWLPARVPGTAAWALREAGLWQPGEPYEFDEQDWWFRTSFRAEPLAEGERASLHLGGIATVAEVYLNGELLLASDSMFAAHSVALGERLITADHGASDGDGDGDSAANELAIRCRALAPLLAERRRPRARWHTRLVPERNLRFFRTMLLGRAPGFAPGPAAVGPWRAVALERHRHVSVAELSLRARVEDGGDGVLAVSARLFAIGGTQRPSAVTVELDGPSGVHRAALAVSETTAGTLAAGELRVPAVARWWPHTHGTPALHDVRLLIDQGERTTVVEAGRTGFRELLAGASAAHEPERDGLDVHINGVRVFARGGVWTPLDIVGLNPSTEDLRTELSRLRDAGMNMVRLPGTSAYETGAFHDLCDELGMLVWQDFMFANFDYPIEHEPFRASVAREARELLAAVGGRPSLTVLCGNSEVEQQVAMLGLEPALGRGELFGEMLPAAIAESGVDAVYVPSAPCGGDLPFRPDQGIANYYGVGGYRRALEDARRAGVRFAAECLAFANVPSEGPAEPVPQDEGADWDFADVRDHYLGVLYGLDAAELRAREPERYVELSRAVTGEVMAEVFGEWRRAGSPCGGGLVLWLRDLLPGAGWGVIDYQGAPKLAFHHLARALAPVAVWTVDEGLGGIVAHVANDRPEPLAACLRVSLYREGELCVEQASVPVELAAHSQGEWNVESVIGHFVDASWAYRFGPPAQDAIVVSLERGGAGAGAGANADADADADADAEEIISQVVRFPAGRPRERESSEELGLSVLAGATLPDGRRTLTLTSRRLAYGVRISAPGLLASDDGFFIEPGASRRVMLSAHPAAPADPAAVMVRALNMHGQLELALGAPEKAGAR